MSNITWDRVKQIEKQMRETDKEMEVRVILHGREWSGFVWIPDMIIF